MLNSVTLKLSLLIELMIYKHTNHSENVSNFVYKKRNKNTHLRFSYIKFFSLPVTVDKGSIPSSLVMSSLAPIIFRLRMYVYHRLPISLSLFRPKTYYLPVIEYC